MPLSFEGGVFEVSLGVSIAFVGLQMFETLGGGLFQPLSYLILTNQF